MGEHVTKLWNHRASATCSLIGPDHNWVQQAMPPYRKSTVSHEKSLRELYPSRWQAVMSLEFYIDKLFADFLLLLVVRKWHFRSEAMLAVWFVLATITLARLDASLIPQESWQPGKWNSSMSYFQIALFLLISRHFKSNEYHTISCSTYHIKGPFFRELGGCLQTTSIHRPT